MLKNKKKTKLLVFYYGIPAGGIDTYLKSLIPGLLKNYEIILVSGSRNQIMDTYIKEEHLQHHIIPLKKWYLFFGYFHLARLIIKENIKILLTQEIILSVLYRPLKVFLPKLQYFTVIHSDIRMFGHFSRRFVGAFLFLNRATAFLNNKYFCVSEYLAYKYLVPEGVPASKIKVIHSGMVLPQNIETKKKNASSNVWKVGFVGRLSCEKGFDQLLDIAKRIRLLDNKIQFHVAGEGTFLYNEAKQLEIESSGFFKLHGYLDNISRFYNQMDCIVVPSKSEGFCYILLEAFNYGVPVICSDSGSLPELVGSDKAAIICKTGDIDAFVSAIMVLKKDIKLKVDITSTAKKRANDFSLAKMHINYLEALVKC